MKPALTLIPALYLAFACGPGTTAEAIRPKEQTAAEALGEGQCRDVSRGAEPLVVDWKPEQRGELEVAMKEGVAVMAYSCDTIRLLEDCRLEGGYGFIGMTRREQVVQLESSDELKANLPLTGATSHPVLDAIRAKEAQVAARTAGRAGDETPATPTPEP